MSCATVINYVIAQNVEVDFYPDVRINNLSGHHRCDDGSDQEFARLRQPIIHIALQVRLSTCIISSFFVTSNYDHSNCPTETWFEAMALKKKIIKKMAKQVLWS